MLIFFNRGCVTPTELTAANQSAAASLAVASGLHSAPGQTITVPLQLGTGGNQVAAATFALDFDAAHFTFDPTDSDGNGVATPTATPTILPTTPPTTLIPTTEPLHPPLRVFLPWIKR